MKSFTLQEHIEGLRVNQLKMMNSHKVLSSSLLSLEASLRAPFNNIEHLLNELNQELEILDVNICNLKIDRGVSKEETL